MFIVLNTFSVTYQKLKQFYLGLFFSIYDVSNIENNCISALYSRIDFVQRNEPRSNYIPIYENDEIESADEEST